MVSYQYELDVDTAVPVTTGIQQTLESMSGFSVILQSLPGQVGTLQVQVSNEQKPTIWADHAAGMFIVNGAGIQSANFENEFYLWMRLVYTAASGAGTLKALLNFKGP